MDWLDWKIVVAVVIAAVLGGMTAVFGTDMLLAAIVLPLTLAIAYVILVIIDLAIEQVRGSSY